MWKTASESAPSSAQNGQALEEAEKIKRERGDDFRINWRLGYGTKMPNNITYFSMIQYQPVVVESDETAV